MQIIKLDATDSTNTYLKKMLLSEPLNDLTVIVADNQLKGRGQMGTHWESQPGKNLTFSILKKMEGLHIDTRFRLNICISLAMVATLTQLQLPDVKIKWPNDILSGTSKICGILIENILLGNQIQSSIIGIGLNVNQLTFGNLNNVSSLKLLLGRTFDLEELLHKILMNLKRTFFHVEGKFSESLWNEYEELLFRKDKPSTFRDSTGILFMGFIRGVSKEGKLRVMLEDKILKEFDLKEIRLMY